MYIIDDGEKPQKNLDYNSDKHDSKKDVIFFALYTFSFFWQHSLHVLCKKYWVRRVKFLISRDAGLYLQNTKVCPHSIVMGDFFRNILSANMWANLLAVNCRCYWRRWEAIMSSNMQKRSISLRRKTLCFSKTCKPVSVSSKWGCRVTLASYNFSTVSAYNISKNPQGNTFFLLFNLEISTTSFCVLSSIGHRTSMLIARAM